MENYFLQTGIREQDLHVAARLNDQEAVKRLVSCGLGAVSYTHLDVYKRQELI